MSSSLLCEENPNVEVRSWVSNGDARVGVGILVLCLTLWL